MQDFNIILEWLGRVESSPDIINRSWEKCQKQHCRIPIQRAVWDSKVFFSHSICFEIVHKGQIHCNNPWDNLENKNSCEIQHAIISRVTNPASNICLFINNVILRKEGPNQALKRISHHHNLHDSKGNTEDDTESHCFDNKTLLILRTISLNSLKSI